MNDTWFYPLWGESDCLALGQDNLFLEALVVWHASRFNVNDLVEYEFPLTNVAIGGVKAEHQHSVTE